MRRADVRAVDDARLSRHRAAWVTPPEPRPDADGAAWARWADRCERQADLLEAEQAALEHPWTPEPVRGSVTAWARPLMAPVERVVRPRGPVDPRQMELWAPERREEAA